MIRLAALLVKVALVSLMSIVFEGAKLWLLIKPVQRIRQWRTKRKLRSWVEEHGGPPDEIKEPFHPTDEEPPMGEAWKSHGRSALKVIGTALAAAGVLDAGNVELLVQAAEVVLGAGIALYGIWQSHKQHAE